MKTISEHLRATARSWKNAVVGAALVGGGGLRGLPMRARLSRGRLTSEALAGRTVLVTGASSGIGRAVALKVAAAGATAVLVARSVEKLDELVTEIASSGGRAHAYAADLSSADSIDALLEHLAHDGIVVDVLVNNAGRSIRRAVDSSYERIHDYERTMALNYFGSVRLILGLLPGMRERKRGHVVNVSSAGVQMGTPLFSAYIASKAALDAFTRVVASETHDDAVHFTTVHMPLVRTPMIAPTEAYRHVDALSPEEAADLVLRALATKEVQVGTRLAGLFSLGHVLAPEAAVHVLALGLRLMPAQA